MQNELNDREHAQALRAALAAADAAASVLLAKFESRSTGLESWEKSPGALVTEADIESDDAIATALGEHGAVGRILSEESSGALPTSGDHDPSGVTWLVDPLCGTVPFSTGMSHWGVSIAMRRDDALAVAVMSTPASGETLSAHVGEGAELNGRRLTSALPESKLAESTIGLEVDGPRDWGKLLTTNALKWVTKVGQVNSFASAAYPLMQVCLGRLAGVVFYNIEPMHVAAGSLIAQELGAIVSDGVGTQIDWSTDASLSVVVVGWPSVHGELVEALGGGSLRT